MWKESCISKIGIYLSCNAPLRRLWETHTFPTRSTNGPSHDGAISDVLAILNLDGKGRGGRRQSSSSRYSHGVKSWPTKKRKGIFTILWLPFCICHHLICSFVSLLYVQTLRGVAGHRGLIQTEASLALTVTLGKLPLFPWVSAVSSVILSLGYTISNIPSNCNILCFL